MFRVHQVGRSSREQKDKETKRLGRDEAAGQGAKQSEKRRQKVNGLAPAAFPPSTLLAFHEAIKDLVKVDPDSVGATSRRRKERTPKSKANPRAK